ncbi:MAG: acetyl-CoA carboxylase biotin carboxyl carrier protein [Eubacterium sp.]
MNINEIEKIVQIFEKSTLSKMELQSDDITIKLEKEMEQNIGATLMPSVVPKSIVVTQTETDNAEKGHWITSPLVGTFYQSNIKDAAPLVRVGDTVKKGDILCIIEAMKMMNEIRSDVDGIVLAIDVENEMMVEFDQKLICIGDMQ